MALWLCKDPCLEGCLVNLPFSALLSQNCPFPSPGLLQPLIKTACKGTFNPVWMIVLQFSHLHNFFTSQKYKERSFIFSFLKCPIIEQGSAEQDAPCCASSILHGCCSYSLPWCPIPSCHIQQCMAASITPHTVCRRETAGFFFLLLVLQQTALWTAAILIRSLEKYMQIPEVLYKSTHIWPECDEAKRAKQCFR